MKKLILAGVFILLVTTNIKAQLKQFSKPLANPKLSNLPTLDTQRQIELWQQIQKNKEALQPDKTPQLQQQLQQQNQMPVVGIVPSAQLVGNNKNGFDILQSPVDNMKIIKPDSSVVFNMPTGKDKFLQLTPKDEK